MAPIQNISMRNWLRRVICIPFERRLWGTPPDAGLSLELIVCRRRRDLVYHHRRAVAVVSMVCQTSMAERLTPRDGRASMISSRERSIAVGSVVLMLMQVRLSTGHETT